MKKHIASPFQPFDFKGTLEKCRDFITIGSIDKLNLASQKAKQLGLPTEIFTQLIAYRKSNVEIYSKMKTNTIVALSNLSTHLQNEKENQPDLKSKLSIALLLLAIENHMLDPHTSPKQQLASSEHTSADASIPETLILKLKEEITSLASSTEQIDIIEQVEELKASLSGHHTTDATSTISAIYETLFPPKKV